MLYGLRGDLKTDNRRSHVEQGVTDVRVTRTEYPCSPPVLQSAMRGGCNKWELGREKKKGVCMTAEKIEER
jgi:hypothetical protein